MSSYAQRRIASHYLLTPQGFYNRPLITIDVSTGKIISIEHYNNFLDSQEGVEFYSGIITPAFVNAHAHIELSYLKNHIPQSEGYAAFASAIGKVRNNFTEPQRIAAAKIADNEMWNEGIDIVGDIVNNASSFSVKHDSKIVYRSFAEVFGLHKCNLEQQFELLNHPYTSLTPHSTYSVQDDAFYRVCNMDTSKPLSIHFMESPDERYLFANHGLLYDWYQRVGFTCDFLHYGSPAERIIKCVPKNRSIILVHNCYVTQADIDMIMNHFTASVYWVLCPRSNKYISGIKPLTVDLLRSNKLTICIGTDSLASNWSLSMIEELKCFNGVPLHELLMWATINGAKALGVNDDYGSIRIGKKCGLIQLQGIDLQKMAITQDTHAIRIV